MVRVTIVVTCLSNRENSSTSNQENAKREEPINIWFVGDTEQWHCLAAKQLCHHCLLQMHFSLLLLRASTFNS
jgi:hypothetical protein